MKCRRTWIVMAILGLALVAVSLHGQVDDESPFSVSVRLLQGEIGCVSENWEAIVDQANMVFDRSDIDVQLKPVHDWSSEVVLVLLLDGVYVAREGELKRTTNAIAIKNRKMIAYYTKRWEDEVENLICTEGLLRAMGATLAHEVVHVLYSQTDCPHIISTTLSDTEKNRILFTDNVQWAAKVSEDSVLGDPVTECFQNIPLDDDPVVH